MERKGNLFQKYWSRYGRSMPPKETPEQEAAELVRETQDANVALSLVRTPSTLTSRLDKYDCSTP